MSRVSCLLCPVGYPVRVPSWTFLTNHAHVLLCIARDPGIRVRDLAQRVGVTERAAQRIVADLIAAEYLERTRDGRRNRYHVRADLPLRHGKPPSCVSLSEGATRSAGHL